jgi:gliding motility-associated-like protein
VYPQPDVDFVPILIGDSLSAVAALTLQTFKPDPVVLSISNGDKVLFYNTSDSSFLHDGEVNLTWSFGDGAENTVDWSPTHEYSNWGDFEVVLALETDKGCISTRSHIVIVEEELEFPNVITPNGDKKNDVFAIKNLNTNLNPEDIYHYRTNNITIYDRWGKKVYSADNYNTYMSKDGELIIGDKFFDGSGLSDGTYYFTFSYKSHYYNKESNFHGTFTILRGK